MLNKILKLEQQDEAIEVFQSQHYRWIMILASITYFLWSPIVEYTNPDIHDPIAFRFFCALPFLLAGIASFFVKWMEEHIYPIFVTSTYLGTIINFYIIYNNNMALEFCAGFSMMMYCILSLLRHNHLKYTIMAMNAVGILSVAFLLFGNDMFDTNHNTIMYITCFLMIAVFVYIGIYSDNKFRYLLNKNSLENSKLKQWSAMGKMAGGVAHEINSPLTTLLFSAEASLAKAKLQGDTNIIKYSNKIIQEAKKIAQITKSLRQLTEEARQVSKQVCNLNTIIKESIGSLHNDTLLTDVRIENLVPEDIDYEIYGDAEVLKLVLVGMINNAIEAAEEASERLVKVKIDEDRYTYKILVQDSGKGISEEQIPSLFTPFYSTKTHKKTKGLSLSMSKNQIMAHDGDLYYAPDYNYTTFIVELPKYSGDAKKIA